MNTVAIPASPPNAAAAPVFGSFLAELAGLVRAAHKRDADHVAAEGYRGRDAPVMVIPGFMASDRSTKRLRGTLTAAGYRAHGWSEGLNLGVTARRFDEVRHRVVALAEDSGAPVALVGWSLGGLYARELAKREPDAVRSVVTLGSPFSGNPRHNRVWRAYELIARHPVDRPPIDVILSEKPPVPTTALWSRRDGMIAPACAHGATGEADRAIELDCTHMTFPSARCSLKAVLEALAV